MTPPPMDADLDELLRRFAKNYAFRATTTDIVAFRDADAAVDAAWDGVREWVLADRAAARADAVREVLAIVRGRIFLLKDAAEKGTTHAVGRLLEAEDMEFLLTALLPEPGTPTQETER